MNKLSSLLLGLLIGLIAVSCQQKETFNLTINATITGLGDKMAYLQQRKNGDWVKIDSITFVDDKGVFNENIDLPEFFYLTIKGDRAYVPFFAEPGNISLTTSVNNMRDAKVEGSKSQDEYDSFMAALAKFDEQSSELGKRYQEAKTNGNEDEMAAVEEEYNGLEKEKSQSMLDNAKTNNESVVAAYVIMSNSYLFDLEQLDGAISGFSDKISDSYYVKFLQDRVATLKSVAVGQKFIDFTLNDPDGNPIPLSSKVNDNYVLVDFWASWCGPCRAENPNVVEAYNKFHDKGFDVFGVSFDKDHDKWVKAIEDDNLIWSHVSDLKYWSSAAGKLYGVQSIPHNVLLSPEGVIIAKDLRGEELQSKLAELLGE